MPHAAPQPHCPSLRTLRALPPQLCRGAISASEFFGTPSCVHFHMGVLCCPQKFFWEGLLCRSGDIYMAFIRDSCSIPRLHLRCFPPPLRRRRCLHPPPRRHHHCLHCCPGSSSCHFGSLVSSLLVLRHVYGAGCGSLTHQVGTAELTVVPPSIAQFIILLLLCRVKCLVVSTVTKSIAKCTFALWCYCCRRHRCFNCCHNRRVRCWCCCNTCW